jgi:hypothetical protein
MDLQEVGWDGMDWFSLAEERDKWWSLLNAVINLLVPKTGGNLLTEDLLASEEGFCSI